MKTVVNQTGKALRIPLSRGRVLRLGPRKEGQIRDPGRRARPCEAAGGERRDRDLRRRVARRAGECGRAHRRGPCAGRPRPVLVGEARRSVTSQATREVDDAVPTSVGIGSGAARGGPAGRRAGRRAGAGRAAGNWTAPRTAAGHPDLQGIWANDSATPLERPEGFENRPVLTEEEFAAFQARAAELTSESADAGFLDEVFLAAASGPRNSRRSAPAPATTTTSG